MGFEQLFSGFSKLLTCYAKMTEQEHPEQFPALDALVFVVPPTGGNIANGMTLEKRCTFLHQEIQSQRQNGVVFVFLRVACHQKQQQNNDQVAGVKILRQQLL